MLLDPMIIQKGFGPHSNGSKQVGLILFHFRNKINPGNLHSFIVKMSVNSFCNLSMLKSHRPISLTWDLDKILPSNNLLD